MSHAEIGGNCGACHASPMSRQTMADRCMDCHENVREQLNSNGPLHGRLPDGRNCRSCHTEHKGARAEITSFASFDHGWTSFALAGAHENADCRSCHTQEAYHGTPNTCVACHGKVDAHKGRYGNRCEQCHKSTAWADASFKHRFPIDHGSRRRSNTCATCHSDETNLKSYTCYNCHEHREDRMVRIHQRRKIANLAACADCHRMNGKRRRDRADAAEIPADLAAFLGDASHSPLHSSTVICPACALMPD
jgi:hypothetical protein